MVTLTTFGFVTSVLAVVFPVTPLFPGHTLGPVPAGNTTFRTGYSCNQGDMTSVNCIKETADGMYVIVKSIFVFTIERPKGASLA